MTDHDQNTNPGPRTVDAASPERVVDVVGLEKSFGDNHVLRDISLRLAEGTVTAPAASSTRAMPGPAAHATIDTPARGARSTCGARSGTTGAGRATPLS